MSSPSDPATWASASYSDDPAESCDTLEDVLAEVAHAKLGHLAANDRKRVVPIVTQVAMLGIRVAQQRGMLDEHNGQVAWSPRFREILSHIFAEMLDAKNPRLVAQCFDFVFGLGLQMGVSESDIAKPHGMTRANVSKLCVRLRERYAITPSRGMRSVPVCKAYAIRQTGKRARPMPEPWSFKATLTASIHGSITING